MTQSPDRWRRIEDIVHAALARPAGERPAFLASACGNDDALRREVESLVDGDARADAFLESGIERLAAAVIGDSPSHGGADDTAPDNSTRLAVGRRLNEYEIRGHLGAGGMGEVYRAHDHTLGREVAVKLLPRACASDPERLTRFEREARLLASLNHPHIGAIYGLERVDGTPAIILELIEGETLASRLSRGPMPLPEALTVAVQVVDALDHAHRKGIVHRDLKPANIMLTGVGAKIVDFGLATWGYRTAGYMAGHVVAAAADGAGARLTEEGIILGTLHYMAPEQLEGKPVDARADVFAFGAVLYEMVTGRKAFTGSSATAVIGAVMQGEPAAFEADGAANLRSLRRTIWKCLAKDPDRRWQSAQDLGDELRWIAGGSDSPDTERPPSLHAAIGRVVRSPARAAGAVAVVVALAAGLAVWAARQPETARAPQPTARFTIEPGAGATITGFDISPDGSRIVYGVADRTKPLYLRALDSFDAAPVAGTEGGETPFFSPDGEWVAFSVGERLLKVRLGTGAVPQVVCERCPVLADGRSIWLPDGTILFAQYGQGLQRVSAEGGEPVPVTTVAAGSTDRDHHTPSLLPGGEVLYTQHAGFGEFNVVAEHPATHVRRVLVESAYDGQYLASGHLMYVKKRRIMAVPFDAATLAVSGAPVTLVEGVAADPDAGEPFGIGYGEFRVSQSGTLVFRPVASDAERLLTWVDRSGAATPIPLPAGAYGSPRVSPDGTRLAFSREENDRRDIWTYELATRTLTRLTRQGDNRTPFWTPDGRRLVYSARVGDGQQLVWQAADGSDAPAVLVTGGRSLVPGAWLPDARSLVYVDGTDYRTPSRMFLLRLDGSSRVTPLAPGPGAERHPSISPDGRWLAFTAMDTGRTEVYVMPLSGSGARRQVTVAGGREPTWSRDGRELYYRFGDSVTAAPFDPARGSFGTPRQIAAGRYVAGNYDVMGIDYDVAADGRLLVMTLQSAADVPRGLSVVVHWAQELQRRVPTLR